MSLQQGLPRLTIRQLNRLLHSGVITSEQLCAYSYTVAQAGEDIWKLNAFERLVERETLLDAARKSDQRRKSGHQLLSPLDGIPISIKANIAVSSQPLTAGSRILGASERDTPAVGYSADVVRCLLDESGAVLLGMTSLDEFGMGSLGTFVTPSTENDNNTTTAPTKNPLPLLQRIGKVVVGDKAASEIVQLPPDAILEAHADAFSDDLTEYSAGGSSCGSAASVAHGSSMLALGTDTGGSVRLPAAWCGIIGLKPSYGLLSRDGLVSYASSLDTVGILAGSVDCAALALDRLAQQETDRDSTMTKPALPLNIIDTVRRQSDADEQPRLSGLQVGIPAAFSVDECPPAIRDAWAYGAEQLERQGASIEVISVSRMSPEVLQKSLAAYYVLSSAEASSNLGRYDGFRYGVAADPASVDWEHEGSPFTVLERQYAATRTSGFGREVTRRILCGTSVLSSDRFHTYYEAAARLRAVLTRQLHRALEDCDLLLVPTTVFPPPSLHTEIDQTEMFANDVMTVPISLAGLPAVSVPVGSWNDQSSLFRPGLQLVAPRHGEADLLRAASALERSCDKQLAR